VYEIQTARQADRQAAGGPEGGEAHTPRENKGPQGRRETDAASGCKAGRTGTRGQGEGGSTKGLVPKPPKAGPGIFPMEGH